MTSVLCQKNTLLAVKIYTEIAKKVLDKNFVFPTNPANVKYVRELVEKLRVEGGGELSEQRIIDFCKCQINYISNLDNYKWYLKKRWNPSHSFGKKAYERYKNQTKESKYYVEKKMREKGVAVKVTPTLHPLTKYIYIQTEDEVKMRNLNTPSGYVKCGCFTLGYTPSSPICQLCTFAEKCKKRTRKQYPELYRLRITHNTKENEKSRKERKGSSDN